MTRNVEKAILDSPLGLNPVGEGQEIVVRVPAPTEESREQMRKIVRAQAEQAKVRLCGTYFEKPFVAQLRQIYVVLSVSESGSPVA